MLPFITTRQQAQELFERIVEQMKQAQGITEAVEGGQCLGMGWKNE